MNAPAISVVLVTYQHEKYLRESVQSVLDQTFQDFELIIVDDGSTDRTSTIAKEFTDARITFISQKNQGPSVATNTGILVSKGKYVAIICGDDVWYPDRLQRQYDAIRGTQYRLSVSRVDLIDEDSNLITGPNPARDLFDLPQLSRATIFRKNFFEGPCINGIASLVERQLFLDAGLYLLSSIQAQDFHMFARIALTHDVQFISHRLVKYRLRAGNQNLHRQNVHRAEFEILLIYRELMELVPIELFREAFLDELTRPDFHSGPEFEIEKALVCLKHRYPLYASIGNERLFQLFRDPEHRKVAIEKYGIDLPKLYEINGKVDIARARAYEELVTWTQQLTEAKEYFLAEIAKRDLLLANPPMSIDKRTLWTQVKRRARGVARKVWG